MKFVCGDCGEQDDDYGFKTCNCPGLDDLLDPELPLELLRKAFESVERQGLITPSVCTRIQQLANLIVSTSTHDKIYIILRGTEICGVYNTLDGAFAGVKTMFGACHIAPMTAVSTGNEAWIANFTHYNDVEIKILMKMLKD